ncbi:hypothetical protein WJX79_010742 [Trebouxia sp. C0005]
MAVDYVNPVDLSDITSLSWSQASGEGPWLAAVSSEMQLYDAEGAVLPASVFQTLQDSTTKQRRATCIAWHPVLPVLAWGTEEGDVCCWHGVSHALSKDSKTHHSAVTCLEWNAQSSILASGDDKGHVGLWRLDSSSKPGLLMHFAAASPGPVTHILFGSSSGAESDTDKATVYYSVTVGDSSHIHCADTDGHHSETFCLESQAALLGLFWHAAKSQLVSVAKTGDFYIHGEEEEGRGWQQIVKMKIGGGAGPEGPALMVAWVGDQTLASASGRDDVVRLYDLDTEDNYILRLDDDIRSEMSATISSLSWSVAAGILSAGTSTGRMAFWKHEQGMALSSSSSAHHMDADPSVHWLLQRGMTVAGRVNNVVWGHGDSVLAVQSGTTIHICQRGLLQRRCCGLLAAVQLSAHEVAIESMQGSNTLQVASGLQIRGLGLSETHLLLHNTSRLCMWSLSGREAKPYGGAGRVLDLPPDLLLISMRCNCDGSKVSMLTRQASSSQQQSQELFVYDECQPTEACQGVVAVAAPFLYTFDTTSEAVKSHQRQVVHQTVMHTFIGMQDVDRQTSRALLDFSYHLAIGDMNEAYKAVKLVKTAGLWRSLCLSAVRSRRHQVVQFCLDNMEDVQCAQAAREFGRVAEPDARLGLVAMQLGQLEEAKKLFTCAARPDLLNKLLQACGEWDEALRVADKHDRINLKATHFRLAQHHEGMGDFAAAMKHYQLSDTHRQEVPRMLFEAEQIAQLATYVTEMNDPELLCWWGRYNESLGQFDTALEAYQQANDTVALVRLHCHQEDFVAACDVVEKSDSAAAAFMLARQLEATEQVAEAVHYFGKAQRTNHGVRLAKQHGMDSELLEQALKSSPLLMLDTAEYFEQRRELDKAVLLYQKAGKQRRALELCFSAQLFDTLASIANNLTAKSDPAVMARCADFFLEHGEHEKGVQLLMQACQFSRALDVCNHNSITLTETMAEAMTPGQGTEAKEREGMLRRIAKLAKQQGSFHLACKKYTQAGDKVKALKCLIRSGDTDKIIFFAGVSRHAEIYTLAANYLQTLDWHARPDLAQSITTFYSKAKAWDSLALFFEACAQIEIDDFRDYQKALQALQEALKYVQKSQKSSKQAVTESLTGRIAAITAFLQAQQLFGSDAASAVQMCNGLIVELSSDDSTEGDVVDARVRIGDVYALLVEYWATHDGMQQAHQLLERMRITKVPSGPYIEANTVEAVYQAVQTA